MLVDCHHGRAIARICMVHIW